MTAPIPSELFVFLKELASNNDREWFALNKGRYLAAKEAVEALAGKLIGLLAAFDPLTAELRPQDCLFRIYRDTRFSKDKRPYKTHFGLWFSPEGRTSGGPGYYLHLEPGASFIAGGYWMPPAEHLKAIRQEIDYNGEVLKQILSSRSFRKYFTSLDEEHKLKSAPQGYSKEHPDIELLKLKSFTVSHPLEDERLMLPGAPAELAEGWKALYPLNQFLRTALAL